MAAPSNAQSRLPRLRSALGREWLVPLAMGAVVAAGPALAQPGQAPANRPGSPAAESPTASPSLAPQAKPEPKVLISEVVVKGTEGHPERERLDLAVYDAMATRPGSRVTRSELQGDLSAIYATGWFADARIQPVDSPLGVQLVVTVVPNPVLTKVELDGVGRKTKIPPTLIPNTFAADYGKTLNLNALQSRIAELQRWYADQGYSLARISGPTRVSPAGVVQLLVKEGSVAGVEVQFLNKEGESTNDKGQPIKGKTKPWVVTREISIKPGDPFNRRQLEEDIKRLYGTGLFGDVKVTLRPVAGNPGEVTIVLGIVEQSTGSLSGGIGYSQSQGVFGQVQLQDNNLGGRAWDAALNVTYGQFGGLADVSFTDPWLKGDKYRTAFRTKVYLSRDVPQLLQSQNNGYFSTVSKVSSGFFNASPTATAYTNASNGSPFFTLDGNTVAIQRTGATVSFVRPLNGGDPFKKAPWSLVVGVNAQEARPMNFGGQSMPYAVATNTFSGGNTQVQNVICIAYNCQNGATTNPLLGVRVAATMTTLNDPRNPTSGNFLSLGTEQFVSVGQNSPTFNRMRASGTHFIPVNWLKLYKGCRPKPGQKKDCNQALAFQLSLGSNVGQLPVYEAFCLGGNNSVRGYYDCDLGVGKSFGEATIEYRFPIFSIISGEVFIDGGTTFNTQANVTGNPGGILKKAGSGSSPGVGLIVTTPVGPLRLEAATQNFTSNWRFNLGVGWKF